MPSSEKLRFVGEVPESFHDMPPEVIGSTRRQLGLVRPEDIMWGKFASALVAALRSGDIRQSLQDFYTSWAPQTTAELLGLKPRLPWHHLPAVEYTLPWSSRCPGSPYRELRKVKAREAAYSVGLEDWQDSGDWKEFGPPSPQLVELEARRLERVRDSIVTNGFRIQEATRVQPFIAGETSRFLADIGEHRLACAVALGFDVVPVVANWGRPVFLKDHAQWRGVRQGHFSAEEAVHVFGKYFADQGV